MNRLIKRLLLPTLLLCAATTQAKTKTSDWYQIEVIIFAQSDNPLLTELWRDTFTPDYTASPIQLDAKSDESDEFEIQGNETETLDTEPVINVEDGAFLSLAETERVLTSAASRIKASADLRLLSHLAWRQPVPRGEAPQPILIQTGEQFNDEFELEGTLAIRRGRYLHARTDLFFSRFEEMKPVEELDWTIFSGDDLEFGQRDWNPSFNESNLTALQFVRASTANLKQSRRMRSGELHYIDHPLFGLLVQITPYKLPDPAMKLQSISLDGLPEQRPLPDSAISPNL